MVASIFVYALAVEIIKRLYAPRRAGVSPEIQRLTSAAIISYALCESTAIYGFALFLLNGSHTDFYAFFIISIICFGRYFPRYSQWEEYVKRSKK